MLIVINMCNSIHVDQTDLPFLAKREKKATDEKEASSEEDVRVDRTLVTVVT